LLHCGTHTSSEGLQILRWAPEAPRVPRDISEVGPPTQSGRHQ